MPGKSYLYRSTAPPGLVQALSKYVGFRAGPQAGAYQNGHPVGRPRQRGRTRAADGSGIINIAIFGGAVIPQITGVMADVSGSLSLSLLLPAACYAVIAAFGWYARRPAMG